MDGWMDTVQRSAVCIMNELENGRNKDDSEREAIEIGIHQQLNFAVPLLYVQSPAI